MNELLEKMENLKNELDKNKNVVRIKELNDKINQDKELLSFIEKYRITGDEQIKNKIYENADYIEYKHLENEINFIILKIRSELKKISDKGSCGR